MKGTTIAIIFVSGAFLLGGCGAARKVGKATSKLVTGGGDPEPEASWNAERTWKLMSENPPTYIPVGHDGSATEDGDWYEDKRDGKRLFVPTGGVEGMPESVLRAEAWKATGGKR